MGKLQTLKEFTIEIFLIVKVCLTTFWFWLPPLFAAYLYIQLWLVCIHPLTLAIALAILSIYAIRQDEKRIEARYGLDVQKRLTASHPIGTGPQNERYKWDVEKAVEEYERLLKESREE